ncbi:MAG: HupE/UreJ family protein [Bacteroidota bacterium]
MRIDQKTDSTYELTWKVPTLGNRVPIIVPVFGEGFILEEKGAERLSDAAIRSYVLRGKEELAGKSIRIDRLEMTLIEALVQIQLLNGNSYSFLLQPDQPEKIIPTEPSKAEVVRVYLMLGVEHILEGYDHLLFVLGLLLILSGFGTLLKTITSFTIAHSITLAIAAMGWFSLPQAPVEAVVALSILFLAKEYLRLLEGEPSLSAQYPWLIAFAFGLLHGFGFAGALQEIGFPQQDVPLALFTFNVGVELGQILFVAFVYLLLFLLKKMKIVFAKWTYKVPPYVMGSLAAFWLIQRVLEF